MACSDVPGHNPANRDVLAMGSWAEHEDGSLILVESTEAGRVIYSLFDPASEPVMEYRDAMAESDFKRKFSWKSGDAVTDDHWTWHDKSPFPWDRVIRSGGKPGLKYASAEGQLTAAQRVAEALGLRASAVAGRVRPADLQEVRDLAERLTARLDALGA